MANIYATTHKPFDSDPTEDSESLYNDPNFLESIGIRLKPLVLNPSEEKNCFVCKATEREVTLRIHHISYNPENIVYCCWSCHQKLHNTLREHTELPSGNEIRSISNKLNSARRSKSLDRIAFYQKLDKGIYLKEDIKYNPKTGIVNVYTEFHSNKIRRV